MTMIGKLRNRIAFEQLNLSSDGMGGFTNNWTNVATVWAEIIPRGGNERMFAQRIEENITHLIRIRHRTDLDTSMRVVFGSRVFEIKNIFSVNERKDFLEIAAIEGVGS